jgi:SNF2 family DNA or RNA helicase
MIDRSMSLPMPVKVRPYAHQQAGYDFACRIFGLYDGRIRSHGVAFLMEMGTGKTLTSIGVTGALYQFGLVNRVLVACPLSITGVWEEEFQAFADYPVNITVLKGTSEKKKQQISKIPSDGLQVLIVNYESAWRLEAELLKFDADLIIADEGHKLKDNRSRQSKGMQHLGDKARYKLLLTGTVITNREMDVFSQYRFLDSRIFGTSFYAFRNRYFDMTGYGNHIPIFRQSMADDFLKRMHCIAYRVTKEECLDLPQIREEVRKIELEPKAMRMYEQLQEDCFTQLKGSEVTAANVLTKMLRLSQLTGGHLTDDRRLWEAILRLLKKTSMVVSVIRTSTLSLIY